MMWWGDDWGWQAWLAMSFMMVAFWVPLIWALVAFTRRTGSERRSDTEAILPSASGAATSTKRSIDVAAS